jgi:hypothetical protein
VEWSWGGNQLKIYSLKYETQETKIIARNDQ